jgi:hypothetical protein
MEQSSTMQPPANGSFHPGTMAVSSALAVPVLLRVRVPTVPGQAADYMTVNVANDMYISDVLGESPSLSSGPTLMGRGRRLHLQETSTRERQSLGSHRPAQQHPDHRTARSYRR